MKKCLFILSITLLWVFVAFGQRPHIDFEEYKLDNGLHVILHQDNSTPIITVNIMYHVGAKNDRADRTGFAHFFEHLMFEGSKHIERGEFSEIVERAGGSLNAWTSFDITNYFVLLPSNQLELGLWLESERLMHPTVDSIGIATQKSVVTEEMKQTRDNRPYGSILTETIKRAYSQHPYQWDILGKDEHIRAAEDQEFADYHSMYYVPNNAVLVVTGDIDIEETKVLVEQYFGEIPAGTQEIYRPDVVEPPLTYEVRDTFYDNIQLPAIIHAYHMPATGDDDYYAVDMLGTALSGGQSSRLYKKLVDEKQLALQVQAIPLGLEDPGLFIIFALPNMGVDILELEKAIDEEMAKISEELIDEREMQKLYNQYESRLVGGNTTMSGRASSLANYHTIHGEANLINTEIERYMEVDREQIREAAERYFNPNRRVVLHYLPKM
nr:insulinase family protein [Saprospiraceae bacterium]